MSIEDWVDFSEPPEDDDEGPEAECRRCGKAGLHWEETEVGWRLYNADQQRHVCSAKSVADDFEDLTK